MATSRTEIVDTNGSMVLPKSRAQGAGWLARSAKGERKAKAFKRDWIPIQAAMPIHPGLKEAFEILMGVGEPRRVEWR
jgi:hypothetical protein